MKKWPNEIYCWIEENKYIIAEKSIDDLPTEDREIAIYELKEIHQLKVTKDLIPKIK